MKNFGGGRVGVVHEKPIYKGEFPLKTPKNNKTCFNKWLFTISSIKTGIIIWCIIMRCDDGFRNRKCFNLYKFYFGVSYLIEL